MQSGAGRAGCARSAGNFLAIGNRPKKLAIRSECAGVNRAWNRLARAVPRSYFASVKRGWECGLLGEAGRVFYRRHTCETTRSCRERGEALGNSGGCFLECGVRSAECGMKIPAPLFSFRFRTSNSALPLERFPNWSSIFTVAAGFSLRNCRGWQILWRPTKAAIGPLADLTPFGRFGEGVRGEACGTIDPAAVIECQ